MTTFRRRVPGLRIRLVAGFAAAMLVVLAGAGAFVFWRVRYALDLRLDENLTAQVSDLRRAVAAHPGDPAAAVRAVPAGDRLDLLLAVDGSVLAASPDPAAVPPPPAATLERASRETVQYGRGTMWSSRGRHRRIVAFPLAGRPARVGMTAVRLDQRDEALRELLLQLAVANLLALGVASLVGYRLAHAALAPVERYRTQAEQITAGATGVRLDVAEDADDEVTRLGRTLNTMLAAQEAAALRQRQFVTDASHELRTPLTLLTSEVELALRRPRSREELEATLRAVAQDTQRLVSLADALLTFESAEQVGEHRDSLDVGSVLEAAARRARAVLPAGTSRAVTAAAPPGLAVSANAVALERMLGNLAENAVRHGRGDVTLTATEAPRVVWLTVHDDGTIPPAFLPGAADRFRRADEARATPGAGLGLALVDALARGHGGQLRLCSGPAHHARPTPNSRVAAVPCAHPERGTLISVLLPADP